MCGVLGVINYKSTLDYDAAAFEKALNEQIHRGPDGSGILSGENFIFGHRRLSIIDLDERSAQPMSYADGRYLIVFNGEIYNYRELKIQLLQEGVFFETESDTEVLLAGLAIKGISFIHQCIGMFAFCFHDREKNTTYLVRDRLGVKPLYYRDDNNQISYSSTIKSLLTLNSNVKPSVSLAGVSSYLSYRYPVQELSLLEDVVALEPGQYLEITSSGVKKQKYWDVTDFKEDQDDKGEQYYKDSLKDILADAVRLRQIADVPVGAYLSGGVDSSVLVSLMAKGTEGVNTYTIGFPDEGFNEGKYASLVADRFSTKHKEIVVSSDIYLDHMQKLIKLNGMPLSVPNEVPIWLLSQELKRDITVVLSGEGADEAFMGYGRIFRSAHDYRRLQPGYSWASVQNKSDFLSNFKGDIPASFCQYFLSKYKYINLFDKQAMLTSDVDWQGEETCLDDRFFSLFRDVCTRSLESQISYIFLKMHLPGLLQRLDTSTMAASVEGRVPFADHRVIEFALGVPVHYKLKWISETAEHDSEALLGAEISEVFDVPKSILKSAFEGTLSNQVLYRKKVGFPVPLHNWLDSGFQEMAKEVLLSADARKRGLYNLAALEKGIATGDFFSNHAKALKLWMLVNLELFCTQFT